MKEGPNIAALGSLIGDPARANILTALMSGKALTVSELASEANVTLQTTSSHLSKLEVGGLVSKNKSGRHRYYALADESIGSLLEAMMGIAVDKGYTRTRTGPKNEALRNARVCYNHLAGDMGVQLYDAFLKNGNLELDQAEVSLTAKGREVLHDLGVDIESLEKLRRPLCRNCLDWSVRRSHLAGSVGSAILDRFLNLKWAKREPDSRIIRFSSTGSRKFDLFLTK